MACAAMGSLACGNPRAHPGGQTPHATGALGDAGVVPTDAGPALDEVTARAALFDAFANRGYRLRYDVPVELAPGVVVAVDGYDPDRLVGYEYISAEEKGLEVTAAARAAWPKKAPYILLIGPTDAATLDRALAAFWSRPKLPPGRGQPQLDAGSPTPGVVVPPPPEE